MKERVEGKRNGRTREAGREREEGREERRWGRQGKDKRGKNERVGRRGGGRNETREGRV